MTSIIENPPGTTPGPAPRTPRPWWRKPLTWIIAGIAIVALGGASLAAYAVAGKTTAAPTPAATAPARPAPSSPSGSSAPSSPGVSQEQQLMAWFLATGEHSLMSISADASAVANDAQSLSGTSSTSTARLSADLAKLRHDIAVARANQPPNDYRGFRTHYDAALGHLDNSVADLQRVVTDVNSGDYSAAVADVQNANHEMEQWQSSLTQATDVLGVSTSTQ